MFGTRSVPSENCKQILATPNRLVQTVVVRVRSTMVGDASNNLCDDSQDNSSRIEVV